MRGYRDIEFKCHLSFEIVINIMLEDKETGDVRTSSLQRKTHVSINIS